MLNSLWSPMPQPPRRAGGHRQQQLYMLPPIQAQHWSISRLAAGILQEWAQGSISSSKLQEHMAAACADGLSHPMVQRLAQVQPGRHAHESLMALLEHHEILSLLTPVAGPVSHVVLPSSIVSMMIRHYPQSFRERLGAEPETIRSFWRDFLSRPKTREWAAAHPVLAGKVWQIWCAPSPAQCTPMQDL